MNDCVGRTASVSSLAVSSGEDGVRDREEAEGGSAFRSPKM